MALLRSVANKVLEGTGKTAANKTTTKKTTTAKKTTANKSLANVAAQAAAKAVANTVAKTTSNAGVASVASKAAQKAVANTGANKNTLADVAKKVAQAVSTSAAKKTTATSSGSVKSSGGSGGGGGSGGSSGAKASDIPTMEDFMKTGFYTSLNIPALQEQLARYNVSDADLRAQAEAMYQPAYNMQKTAFENQIAQLGVERDREIQKLNSQYNKTLNSVMAGLNARGMGRSSMVATQGVETENARNAAISDTSYNYLQQQNQINASRQQAEAEYAQNIENKAAEMREKNRSEQINLMAQIAQLQSSGYSAYTNYLLNKK